MQLLEHGLQTVLVVACWEYRPQRVSPEMTFYLGVEPVTTPGLRQAQATFSPKY